MKVVYIRLSACWLKFYHLVLVGADGHAAVAPACCRANKLAASGLDADILAAEVTQVLLCIAAVALDCVRSISYDVLHFLISFFVRVCFPFLWSYYNAIIIICQHFFEKFFEKIKKENGR